MNIADVVSTWALCQPDQGALYFEGNRTTWRRFWNRVERATARLQGEWQVVARERVAYLGLNRPEGLILLFALARLGAILVPLDARLSPMQWRAIAAHARARILLADVSLESQGRSLAHESGLDFYELDALIAKPYPRQPILYEVASQSPVLLVYRADRVGPPRAILHSQEGLLWNAFASIAAHDLTSGDHVLAVLPLSQLEGLCIQPLPALLAGASVTLHKEFDAGAWLDAMTSSRPTLSLLTPAALQAVQEHPGFAQADLSCLRLVMLCSSVVACHLQDGLHARGVPVGQVYGTWESGPVNIVLRAQNAMQKVGYAGWPALYTEIGLVDDKGVEVVPGAVGEISVRARQSMLGYWTSEGGQATPPDRFMSGDLARRDEDGCYQIVGKSGDRILSGGAPVYPAEMENRLLAHPAIAEAAIVGLPHAQRGMVAIAAVVVRAQTALGETDILYYLESQFPNQSRPYRVFIVGHLPKDATGQVDKAELAYTLQPLVQGAPGSA